MLFVVCLLITWLYILPRLSVIVANEIRTHRALSVGELSSEISCCGVQFDGRSELLQGASATTIWPVRRYEKAMTRPDARLCVAATQRVYLRLCCEYRGQKYSIHVRMGTEPPGLLCFFSYQISLPRPRRHLALNELACALPRVWHAPVMVSNRFGGV